MVFKNLVACAVDESSLIIERVNPSNAKATFVQSTMKDAKNFDDPLNPVMLVFVEKLWLSTLR